MTTMTTEIVDDMLIGYIECALWAGLDWDDQIGGNPEPLDKSYGDDDVSDEARAEMREDIESFVEANFYDLAVYAEVRGFDPSQGTIWEHAGHDFYLSRNGAGTGFWDRGNEAVFDRLHQATKPYGTQELYVGDDGKLYVGG